MILETVINGKAQLAISESLLEELRGVLERPKFQISSKVIQAILSEISALAEIYLPTQKIDAVKSDPDDNRVLECALAAKADLIISGDSDLLELKRFRGIPILSPDQYWQVHLKN